MNKTDIEPAVLETRVMEWAAQLWCQPRTEKLEMDVDLAQVIGHAVLPFFEAQEAILHPDVQARLPEIIHELKTGDGEHWAVGEAIERLAKFPQ